MVWISSTIGVSKPPRLVVTTIGGGADGYLHSLIALCERVRRNGGGYVGGLVTSGHVLVNLTASVTPVNLAA